ncbi:hypothetical protein Q3G72_012054 [Acer saccharum]|nr:hypothetical protein Q3G72_012054 [Acer saccharum]
MAPGRRLSAFTMVDSSGDDTSDVNCKGKNRKCRGVTRGLKVDKIVQSVGRIPIRFTPEQKEPAKFDVDLSLPHVYQYVNTTMGKLYSNNRCKMHKHFKSFQKVEDAILKPYTNVSKADWMWLCDHFCSDEFQIRSKRNSKSRNALKIKHRGGSKSIRRLVEEMEEMQKLEGELTHDETPPTDVEIIERVLGPRSAYIKGFRKVHKTLMSSIPSSSTQEVEMIALKAELESTQEELRIAKEKSLNTEERVKRLEELCLGNKDSLIMHLLS